MRKSSTKKLKPQVGIIMGSDSDWPTMQQAAHIFDHFGLGWEAFVFSAHRNPEDTTTYASKAYSKGIKVIIGGAGGAAHLPGVLASMTHLPVIGVPIESKALKGIDSLLSIVQMPPGVPVATVGIGAAKNAGLLAMQILGVSDPRIRTKLQKYKTKMAIESRAKSANLMMD